MLYYVVLVVPTEYEHMRHDTLRSYFPTMVTVAVAMTGTVTVRYKYSDRFTGTNKCSVASTSDGDYTDTFLKVLTSTGGHLQ